MFTIMLIHFFGLASPGPDFLYVVRQSVKGSTRAGILASIGISIGIVFWAALSIFGLAWLTNSVGVYFQYGIMLIGGSYLSYLGWKMLRVSSNTSLEQSAKNIAEQTACKEIRQGVLVNIFNAKAGVYFTSVVSAYIGNFQHNYELWLLLFLFVITTLFYFCTVALLFSRKPIRDFYAKYSRYIDNVAGAVFLVFGGKLIYSGITGLIG